MTYRSGFDNGSHLRGELAINCDDFVIASSMVSFRITPHMGNRSVIPKDSLFLVDHIEMTGKLDEPKLSDFPQKLLFIR